MLAGGKSLNLKSRRVGMMDKGIMSRVQLLRVLVNERLSAAAEEIFEAVKKTIAGYEEEIQLCRREVRRQRRMLRTAFKPEINKVPDQPQLALSVWDEDFPSNQQQERCDQEWSSGLDQEDQEPPPPPPERRGARRAPPTNELDQLQSGYQSSKGGGADPLPRARSAEREQAKAEAEDGASSSCSPVEHDDSDEEWRGSAASPSDDSDSNHKWKKRKGPRLPTAPKLHPTKKAKSRICCKVCGKAFHANVSLVNHMEVHPKDVCGVCGERFDTEESFQVHLKTHVKAEICSVCGKCFGASSSLETHMRIHTGEKPFNCSECGKSFNCRHNMMRHIRIHTGEKPYPCSVCGKCFNDYSTLKRHLLVHVHKKNLEKNNTSANENENSNDTEKKLKTSAAAKKQQSRTICEVCGKMFHSMVSLVNHAKSHATDLCGVCGMHFDSEENLKLHLKTHKNGKVCEVCGKCFDSQGNLEMHMRIHTGEKPFLCSECGKSFNCRHNMMRHIRTHTGEKPYLCNTCGRCFSDHSTLKQHSSTHTGEKPHRCEICGKGFHRKTDTDPMMAYEWAEDDFDLPAGIYRLGLSEPVSGRQYIMYHGTTRQNAYSIQASGFCQSPNGMLGRGVYLSRDLEKASRYPIGHPEHDRVVIRVVVNVGRVIAINYKGHPRQKTWHNSRYGEVYDTAWVPPGCGMVPSGLEENCIWDPNRIQIIDVIEPRPAQYSGGDTDTIMDYEWAEDVFDLPYGASGFQRFADRMLGPGVYLSRDLQKASRYPINHPEYDKVVIKVVVKMGRVIAISYQGHPRLKTWHDPTYGEVYDTACSGKQ
ncbi:hypothetical protein L3Q82_002622 [Scortum barcoo]|uniref:Uncharacterized protein n=1 Tax=Scortum barcoo TaxID=214431 RepID=A0ACB8VV35_9TELE|nr:hypothetical protein L3Q82_002622 [Scortum barcoo]